MFHAVPDRGANIVQFSQHVTLHYLCAVLSVTKQPAIKVTELRGP